jgi:HD superfamily phosphodiesterase
MCIAQVTAKMIAYFNGDVPRINHALKVYGFASAIARLENLNKQVLYIVDIAAVLHDIGIVNAEKKYNSTAGNYQETEGPPVAKALLKEYELSEELVERICFLIGNHHSYTKIDGIDFQILVEADFLVNIFEDKMSRNAIDGIRQKYFKTTAGKTIFDQLYSS